MCGLFAQLARARPFGVRVVGMLALVVNDVGAGMYRADEVVPARSGALVAVVNTDAEGRMAMVDLLCHCKERALARGSPNTHLITVATLTGHAKRTYGPYPAVIGNGVSSERGFPAALQAAGHAAADPWEVSTLRREDYDVNKAGQSAATVLQCPSSGGGSIGQARGHMFPMAFLMVASGLDAHDWGSPKPLAYTHCDIGGATQAHVIALAIPTGRPVASFASVVASAIV